MKANPEHYEIRRWTFPTKKNIVKTKRLNKTKENQRKEHFKETHRYKRVILGESRCNKCGVVLTKENTIPSAVKNRQYMCKTCKNEYNKEYLRTHKKKDKLKLLSEKVLLLDENETKEFLTILKFVLDQQITQNSLIRIMSESGLLNSNAMKALGRLQELDVLLISKQDTYELNMDKVEKITCLL